MIKDDYILTTDNYYNSESNLHYVDYSTYKEFCGSPSKKGCECRGLAEANGSWVRPKTKALAVGSFVDSYFEGSLSQWIKDNPECFRKDNELRAEFKHAMAMIKRAIKEPLFMSYMQGEKQKILTAEIAGVPIRVKMDVFNEERKFVTDLKTAQSIHKTYYAADLGERLAFWEHFAYDVQAVFYTQAVLQNYGFMPDYYLCVITKEKEDGVPHPRLAVIHIPETRIREKLSEVEMKIPKVWSILKGEYDAIPCGTCAWCADNLPLDTIYEADEILLDI